MDKIIAKPFIKWAGGKTQLLDIIDENIHDDIKFCDDVTYIEPFVGGGSMLFHMLQNYPNIKKAIINDINKNLIFTYVSIKYNVNELINTLEILQNEYSALDKEGRKNYYIEQRKIFNNKNISNVYSSALFIFLNKTCFNGLYRVNSKGHFNVPHSQYASGNIYDKENLLAVSKLLQNVDILCGDFSLTEKYANENTLYYIDSPYRPITKTSFTKYDSNDFDDNEQIRLKNFCDKITKNKAYLIANNSYSNDDFFDNLYKSYNIKKIKAKRMINSDVDKRGEIYEILITN